MGIIIWIITGVLVGWVISLFMNTDPSIGATPDILVGSAGAVIGGVTLGYIRETGMNNFDLYGFLAALLGACILAAIVRLFRRS